MIRIEIQTTSEVGKWEGKVLNESYKTLMQVFGAQTIVCRALADYLLTIPYGTRV